MVCLVIYGIEKNHPDFIAVGGTSAETDRYLTTPHAVYEFQIPIEQIGFEDEYGRSYTTQESTNSIALSLPYAKHDGTPLPRGRIMG